MGENDLFSDRQKWVKEAHICKRKKKLMSFYPMTNNKGQFFGGESSIIRQGTDYWVTKS